MADLAQLQSDRAAAAETYLAAVATLRAAFVELAALDQAIASTVVGGNSVARSFAGPLELPAHQEFPLPPWPHPGDVIRARLAQLTA